MIRFLAIVGCALLLGACATTPPITVRDAEAVISQNETTKQDIKGFTEANQRTQTHVKKIEERALEQETSLETAKKYLEELLQIDHTNEVLE